MAGMNKGTRSGLLWEVERLLKETEELPQVLLMENVIQVHSEGDNMNNFQKWIEFLESLGYSNYWQDMNAKNYGMPQNRNRTIMVSILGEYQFKFPKKMRLKKDAYDYLIDTVDEKYYINNENTKILVDNLKKNGTILTDRQTDRQTDRPGLLTKPSMNQKSPFQSIASQEDMTMESDTENRTELVFANIRYFRGEKPLESKRTDVACTILRNKDKGMSNLGEDVIIERTNINNGL